MGRHLQQGKEGLAQRQRMSQNHGEILLGHRAQGRPAPCSVRVFVLPRSFSSFLPAVATPSTRIFTSLPGVQLQRAFSMSWSACANRRDPGGRSAGPAAARAWNKAPARSGLAPGYPERDKAGIVPGWRPRPPRSSRRKPGPTPGRPPRPPAGGQEAPPSSRPLSSGQVRPGSCQRT